MLDDAFSMEKLTELFHSEIAPRGGRGIDRMSISSFESQEEEQLKIVHRKVLGGTYRFTPYLQQLVTRGAHRCPRVISIPTVRDRVVFAALRDYLKQPLSKYVNRRISNARIHQLKSFLDQVSASTSKNLIWQRLDISSFYPSINHDKMMSRLRTHDVDDRAVRLVACAVRTPTVSTGPRSSTPRNTCGVPQGLSISNMLAELVLQPLDKPASNAIHFYDRYADDFLLIGAEEEVNQCAANIEEYVALFGLSLNLAKQDSGNLKNSFRYLGYHIEDGQIAPKKGALERFVRRTTRCLARFRHSDSYPVDELEFDLNQHITGAIALGKQYGWVFYYLASTDISIFYQADHILNALLTRYAPKGLAPLKSVAKAWHEAQYNRHGGYIFNYDSFTKTSEMTAFLGKINVIGQDESLTEVEVKRRFRRFREQRIAVLRKDIGLTS